MQGARKTEGLNDIRAHIVSLGSRDWRLLRSKYAGVSDATWWRWVRAAKLDMGLSSPIRSPGRQGNFATLGTNSNFPTSPAYRVDAAMGGYDPFAWLEELRIDAMALRSNAVGGDGRIRSPLALERAIKLRAKILVTTEGLKSRIYANFHAGAFYGNVIDEITKEAPAVSHRIIERFERLLATMG